MLGGTGMGNEKERYDAVFEAAGSSGRRMLALLAERVMEVPEEQRGHLIDMINIFATPRKSVSMGAERVTSGRKSLPVASPSSFS